MEIGTCENCENIKGEHKNVKCKNVADYGQKNNKMCIRCKMGM